MEVKERGKETKTYQHDQEGWTSGFSRTRSSTRDQEGHQLHMRQVQFHLFQYSSRNCQSRFWPIHSLIFARCRDTTVEHKNMHMGIV